MSIIERLSEAKKSVQNSRRKELAYQMAMKRARQEKARKIKEEVEAMAQAVAEKVGLSQIFDELKAHLSEQNFNVEIEETTSLQAEDWYYGLFSCTHEWIVRWSKPRQPKVNSFLIYINKDAPFFTLRVSGGGTGEATTDFDLGLGVESLDKDRFMEAVAKAFLKPMQRPKGNYSSVTSGFNS